MRCHCSIVPGVCLEGVAIYCCAYLSSSLDEKKTGGTSIYVGMASKNDSNKALSLMQWYYNIIM